MSRILRNTLLAITAANALAIAPLAVSHLDDKQMMQSYRQSYLALLGLNFGPMVAMVKGEIPWDQERLEAFAEDLDTLMDVDFLRGFPPGSERGTTRAKPEIWDNKDDFANKFADLQKAVESLEDAAETGDREAIAREVAATGDACKACHDDYKSKDYLY
ncbi:MAG: cytochrome c [Halioglobus sp.]|nr:cytochrome c [Halioglobus sp.]